MICITQYILYNMSDNICDIYNMCDILYNICYICICHNLSLSKFTTRVSENNGAFSETRSVIFVIHFISESSYHYLPLWGRGPQFYLRVSLIGLIKDHAFFFLLESLVCVLFKFCTMK